MKMIGVCAERLYWRMSFAVSRPSMSGMLTSSRITANSRFSTSFSASPPERTVTRFCPSSSRMLEKTSSFSGRSSTTRMFAFSWFIALAVQPPSQHGQHMHAVDRLGQIVPGAGGNAFLTVALHGFRRDRDDRQVAAALQFPDLLDGGDAVHLRHHDVHQHDVDVGIALHDLDRLAAVVRRDHLHAFLVEHRGER